MTGEPIKRGKTIKIIFRYSPFLTLLSSLLSPSSTSFAVAVWPTLGVAASAVAALVSDKVDAPAIGCRRQGAGGNKTGAPPWQTAKRRR